MIQVDIVVGLCWGDEGKGKVSSELSRLGDYDIVARWAGGDNAGHTIYIDGEKYKTHIIPSGVFYGKLSVIGPGCVVHKESLLKELSELEENGFDSSLVKVSPRAHMVTDDHIKLDYKTLSERLGTTSRGIAPVYSSKAMRTGIRASEVLSSSLLWDEVLHGKVLCEGAQGVWLDVDYGNYPYVTSSNTLPYAACSLGFSPKVVDKIIGVAKLYDTRSGMDPDFPESLLEDYELGPLGIFGKEYGVTTGRKRKCNWLNLTRLITSINLTGTTQLIINKCDIIRDFGVFKVIVNNKVIEYESFDDMIESVSYRIKINCPSCESITLSYSPEKI